MAATQIYRSEDFKQELPQLFTAGASLLLHCYGPLIYLGMRIHHGQKPTEDAEAFRKRLRKLLKSARSQAKLLGVPAGQIDTAEHAIIVSLDSAILGQSGPLQSIWARNSLEMATYRSVVGGHWFFTTLDRLRQARKANNHDLIEIFYLCLMAGFEGELRSNPQQLDRAIQSLQEELRRAGRSEKLSPQAQLDLPPPPQQMPGYLTKIPLVIGVVFVFFLTVFLFGVLVLQASLISDDMRTLQHDIAEEQ